jgi:Transglutaminase-like superfamily
MSRRTLLAFLLPSFWLIMMSLLSWREWGGRRLRAERLDPARAVPSSVRYALLDLQGAELGEVALEQRPETKDGQAGMRSEIDARLRLALAGQSSQLRMGGVFWQGQDRLDFEAQTRSQGFDFQVRGEVEKGRLRATMASAGETWPLELELDQELLVGSGPLTALRLPSCTEGERLKVATLDPLSLKITEARLLCHGRETLTIDGAAVMTQRIDLLASGMETRAFVDDSGEVVRAETPFGLVLERRQKQEAWSARPPDDAGTRLPTLATATSRGLKPQRGATELRVKIRGGPTPPVDGNQQFSADGSLRITTVAQTLDCSDCADPRWRAPERLVQSDHPRLIAQAQALVGAETDPQRRAQKIHDWVFERLDKEAVLSVPSALEVLDKKRGDCNEHTVLFTALARAANLPTRIAIGLVWSDELDGFYYHAWPEVVLDNRWMRFDPTLDQAPADATHIKLLAGGIETWPQLLAYLGQLEIEVLETK